MVAQPRTMLVGQITRPFVVAPTGRIELIAARFLPFGAAMLQQPMAAITDSWVRLAALERVHRAMSTLSTPGERRECLTKALVGWLRRSTRPDQRVQHAVNRIEAADGNVSQAELSEYTGASARTLQRLFARDVGIPIKLLSRVRRFQRVFSAWRDDPSSWAQVAVRCGYFDQAHLVRDFNELGGAAPAGLLTQLPAFTRLFTALRDSAP
jgi:transcriptional regulator GlxA family with amidase domain